MLSNILPLLSGVIKPNWTVMKDVSYGISDKYKVDCYLLNGNEVRPAVVFIHGGGWMSGDKSVYEAQARRYALAGFNVFAINYTLAKEGVPETLWAAQLRDVEIFMLWLRKQSQMLRIDPNRIVASGDSAGGHLALFLATTRNKAVQVSAVLNMYGPTDLAGPEMTATLATTPVFGNAPNSALLTTASPISYTNRQTSPILTIHGLYDNVVPYIQAVKMKNQLDACGVKNDLISFNGLHGLANVPWYVQTFLTMKGLQFLKSYV